MARQIPPDADRVPPRSAEVTVDELRTILLTDPDTFERQVNGLIAASADPVTRQFWIDIKELARRGSK